MIQTDEKPKRKKRKKEKNPVRNSGEKARRKVWNDLERDILFHLFAFTSGIKQNYAQRETLWGISKFSE